MSTTTSPGPARPGKSALRRGRAARPKRSRSSSGRPWWLIAAIAAAVVLVLFGVYAAGSRTGTGGTTRAGGYQVGSPGVGVNAPALSLPASTGGRVSLADYRGRSVLLYFQEGLTCQPCWDQIRDLEANAAGLKSAGVDQVLSVTTDPVNLVARKTKDMGLVTPVLSDTSLAVSKDYGALGFGMMGSSRDGHSFLLVGPDGTIRWRADYGGAPKYTMYVPPKQLLADLVAGVAKTGS